MEENQNLETSDGVAEVNETERPAQKKRKKVRLPRAFTTRGIAGMAIFVALSYGVSFLEFSVFPASPVGFLKLDFSNVFIMLAGFMYGPTAALLVGLCKELLCLIGTSTFGVGQIANALVILAYVIPPSIIYLKYKGIKVVILSLVGACALQITVAMLANKFITFPLYGMSHVFDECFWIILAFNAIKCVSVSILTVLLYKRVAYVFEKIKIR